MGIKFYDTSAFLKEYKYIGSTDNFCISYISLLEIENIKNSFKKDSTTKCTALKAEKFLKSNYDRCEVVPYNEKDSCEILKNLNTDPALYLDSTTENKFCASVLKKSDELKGDIELITDKLSIYNTAKLLNINASLCGETAKIYKGYEELKSEENIDYSKFYNNEYLLFSKDNNDKNKIEYRYFNGNLEYLSLPDSNYIKGKNAQQRCALDALSNENINIIAITGGYGGGKTFLAMKMAILLLKEGKYSKILGIREPIGEGKELGFLPGDFENKTDVFFLPLAQQMDMGIDEYNKMKEKRMFETCTPYFMKGNTYDDTIIIVDEAEDLTEQQIKLIGTRVGEHSKIIFAGDYKQSLINKSSDNPLMKMCNSFKGHNNFACIYLEEDVRSNVSKMFADLYEEK